MTTLQEFKIGRSTTDYPPKHNGALDRIENILNTGGYRSAVDGSVIDKDLNTPPANPVDGDTYIVGPVPTGDWVGHAGQFAYHLDGAEAEWQFITPARGNTVYVEDESVFYWFESGIWNLTNIVQFDQSLNTTDTVTFAGVTAATFTGALVGNADTATLADRSTNVVLQATNTTNATHYVTFTAANTGNSPVRTDLDLTYNPSTGLFTAVGFAGSGASLTNVDAATLGGVSLSAFGRYATAATWTALQQYKLSSNTGIANANSGLAALSAYASAGTTEAAFMTYHRAGAFGAYFGLDIDNKFKWGGWSAGAVAYKFWEEKDTPVVTQAEAEAGTSANNRIWTPQRVSQAIAALASGAANVEEFSASGTWTKLASANFVMVEVWGAGGGGGGGSALVDTGSSAASRGGAGGGGGLYIKKIYAAAELPSSVSVVVGAGGAGGTGGSVTGSALASANGTAGAAGGASEFDVLKGFGGGAGGAGLHGNNNSGGSAAVLTFDNLAADIFDTSAGGPSVTEGKTCVFGGCGGGGGGNYDSNNPGKAGGSQTRQIAATGGGGTGGTPGVAGGAGGKFEGGGGGGPQQHVNQTGGTTALAAPGGAGGTGGGGAGGGGGARNVLMTGTNTATAGNGGNGGSGLVRITTW